MATNNIFTDLIEKVNVLKEKKIQGAPSQKIQRALEAQTGNKSAAKTWLLFFGIAALLTAFVSWLSYNYFHQIFEADFPDTAGIMAIALIILVEGGKVWLSYEAWSAVLFGWMFKKWTAFFFWGMALVFSGGVYYWSYLNSTEGLNIFVQNKGNEKQAAHTLTDHLAAATATIDAQIASINDNNSTAAGMKTKKGRIAWTGQATIQNNSTTLSGLQAQRTTVINAATEEFNNRQKKETIKLTGFASFIERFGGWAEFGLAICLLAMILFDKSRSEDDQQDATIVKVTDKIKASGGIVLTDDQIRQEVEKANRMNGQYQHEPLPGKS